MGYNLETYKEPFWAKSGNFVRGRVDYEISSKRVIELLMFEADKRDNKKLI